MENSLILCPLMDGKMTLLPEVMEKLQVKPGDNVTIVKKDGILFLLGSEAKQDEFFSEQEDSYCDERL